MAAARPLARLPLRVLTAATRGPRPPPRLAAAGPLAAAAADAARRRTTTRARPAPAADLVAAADGNARAGARRPALAPAAKPAARTVGKGADAVFEEVMRRLAGDFDVAGDGRSCGRGGNGRAPLVFPKEITFLNGAPGSGKSSNARFMLEARGLSNRPIVMSDLLERDAGFRAKMDEGELIADTDVVELLFRELLTPEYRQGVLVDGFPRTAVQADSLNLLRARMQALRARQVAGLRAAAGPPQPGRLRYPVPRFFVCILHVTRPQSIERQLRRGADARAHNARVRAAGTGELVDERRTDFDTSLLAERYATFERHRDTLAKLTQYFPFKVIDASQPIAAVQEDILREFQYQSKNDLSRAAFDAIQPVPLASRVGSNARPDLCQRLDEYTSFFPERFARAVALVNGCIIPRLREAAFAGRAIVRFPPESAQHADLGRADTSNFRHMVLDCLAERGFAPHYDAEVSLVPARFDLGTGAIACSRRVVHVFHVQFPMAHLSHHNIRVLNENRENEEPPQEPRDD